jgi:adenylate cyclase
MAVHIPDTVQELVRSGSLLSGNLELGSMISILTEQSYDITASDLACLYLRTEPEKRRSPMRLMYRRGRFGVPDILPEASELAEFIFECNQAVVLGERNRGPFRELLLDPCMNSAVALPLQTSHLAIGVLFLNSRQPRHYGRQALSFLESYTVLAAGMFHNARLYEDLKETLRRVEEMERYQESIFASMTNLLLTTDSQGRLRYFNPVASRRFGLKEEAIGKKLGEIFRYSLDRRILRTIERSRDKQRELVGAEGIFRGDGEVDFSLNQTPLMGKRGGNEGATLLFTDQSRERELREQMETVVEERRLIKNMFTRYLSTELVQHLMDSPELVKPGGDKKNATVLFADIRGYTAFSEGRDPAYIIQVLNAYFEEAVEVVVRHKGYIDKFIGDAIMAAFGVPLGTEEQDAISAVTCALEMQELVRSSRRRFFRGAAAGLAIGIGMHTGDLVAGNLGSRRRMNYTVIGDTVNVAARLESIAGPGEVIITADTRERLGERFRVEQLPAVSVKGKSGTVPIFKVLKVA